MRTLLLLALVVSLGVAGCSSPLSPPTGTPTDTAGTTADVTVANAGNVTYDVEVTLVNDRLRRVTEVGADGVARPVENLSVVKGVYAFAPTGVTDIQFPTEASSASTFQMPPGTSVETSLGAPTRETTLVVVVKQGDRVSGWATVYCGPRDTVGTVDLTLDDRGPFRNVAVQCSPPT